MARFIEPTPEQIAGWNEWVADRPDHVRVVAERFHPWTLYQLSETGHRVTIVAFDEDDVGEVTARVAVSGEFNFVMFERTVFGINPDDLIECDLPAPGEPTGSLDIPAPDGIFAEDKETT